MQVFELVGDTWRIDARTLDFAWVRATQASGLSPR
jgi:hypothetical protein